MNPLLPSTTAMPADVTSQPGANWRKWILLGVMGVAAIVVASLSDVRALLRDALDWIEQLGPWGPILFVLIYVVATVLLVPGSALTLGAGAVFGVVRGTLIVSLASTLAATAAFLVGRYLARDAIARKIERNEKFAAIDKAVADEGWKIVLLTRLSPVFPFSLLNYAFGLTRVRLSHYVLASWIGMLPGTVMYVYLGSLAQIGAGERMRTPGEWVLYGVGLLATVVITVFVTRLARNALEQRAHPKAEP